jgi:hypothetical protein
LLPRWLDLYAAAAMFRVRTTESWPSGLRRTLGKRVCVKAYRGFESHTLRQNPFASPRN